MNKQILKRFDLFKKVKGVKLDLEKVEFENINLVNDPSARILFNPPKDRIKVNKLIEEDALASKIPMDGVDEITGTIKLPIIEEKVKVLEDASYRYFENGDILWAKVTPCMENGNCAIVSNLENGIGYGSTEFHVFRADPNFVTKVYLWYYLRDRSLREKAKPTMTGSGGLKRVPKSFLEGQYIPIPKPSQELTSIEIQKILVDFIQYDNSRWGNKLDKTDELIAALEKLENAIVPKTLEKSPVAMRKLNRFSHLTKSTIDWDGLEFKSERVEEISIFPSISRVTGGVDISLEEYELLSEVDKNKYTPLVSGTVTNNQISGYIANSRISENNYSPTPCLSWTRINASIFFRQNKPVCINDDSFVLTEIEDVSDLDYLNFTIPIEAAKNGFSWGNKAGIQKIKDLEIKLPKKSSTHSSLDYQKFLSSFFKRYISDVQHKKSCIYKSKTAIPAYNDAFIKILFASLKNIAHAD